MRDPRPEPLRRDRASSRLRAVLLLAGALLMLSPRASPAQGDVPVNLAREIARARTGWTGESSRLRSILHRMRSLVGTAERLEERLDKGRAEVRKLVEEKDRALEEMRRGQFCSGCGKTKSQILAEGDRFPHPGQRSLPPTPEQLEALEEKYDRRIAAAKAPLPKLEDELREVTRELFDLNHEYNVRKPNYHRFMAQEQDLRVREWNDERRHWEQRLEDLREAVDAAEAAVSQAKRGEADGQLAPLRTNLRILVRQFEDTLARARSAQARAEQQADAYVQAAVRDLEGTAAIAEPLPNKYGLAGGWFMSRTLKTPNPPIRCTIWGLRRIELSSSPESIRELLEAPAAVTPKPEAPPKQSMKDLLEGTP